MIIDAHVHIAGEKGKRLFRNDASLEKLVTEKRKTNINKCVLLPVSPFIDNALIGGACAMYPEEFIGFGSLDFSRGNSGIRAFRKDVKKYCLKGLKIHPRLQRLRLDGGNLKYAIKMARDLDMPVIIDCFPQLTKDYPVSENTPLRIAGLARAVRGAKIVIAHAGGLRLWEAFIAAKDNPGIYLDFSFSASYFKGTPLLKQFGFILKMIGAERCIYGSDYPEISFSGAFNDALAMAVKAGISERDKEYFFGKTLLSILPS